MFLNFSGVMKFNKASLILILATVLLYACSDSNDDAAEPGSIKAKAEEIGHEAAQSIKAPMDKAQITADQESNRIKELEERLNK